MSAELVQKELDFYQLPFAEELGIGPTQDPKSDKGFQCPMVELFYEIMTEIKTCSLSGLPSFCVFVYYRQVGCRKEGMRRVFVLPPDRYKCNQCIQDRGHAQFDKAIHAGSDAVTVSKCIGGTIVGKPATGEKFRILEIENAKMLSILNQEANKFGMTFSYDSLEFGPEDKQADIGFLKIEYS